MLIIQDDKIRKATFQEVIEYYKARSERRKLADKIQEKIQSNRPWNNLVKEGHEIDKKMIEGRQMSDADALLRCRHTSFDS
jgi:hypothetical protein